MMTFFTAPKPFVGTIKIIQYNAINSWKKTNPDCEIILFGNETGTAEIAKELGLRHISDIRCNSYGTPYINEIFYNAQEITKNTVLCYINSDIILIEDLFRKIKPILRGKQFLIIGQRWDIDITEKLPTGYKWREDLQENVAKNGKIHPPSAIDYIIFSKGIVTDMPPFLIGRPKWDNWLIGTSLRRGFMVIDATLAITAIHQNHSYAHIPSQTGKSWQGPEADYNYSLVKEDFTTGNILDSNWILEKDHLKRAITLPRISHRLYTKIISNKTIRKFFSFFR